MLIDDIRKKDGAPREPAAFVRRFYERFTLVSLREIGASDFAFVQAKPHGSKYAHEMLTREASTDPLVPWSAVLPLSNEFISRLLYLISRSRSNCLYPWARTDTHTQSDVSVFAQQRQLHRKHFQKRFLNLVRGRRKKNAATLVTYIPPGSTEFPSASQPLGLIRVITNFFRSKVSCTEPEVRRLPHGRRDDPGDTERWRQQVWQALQI